MKEKLAAAQRFIHEAKHYIGELPVSSKFEIVSYEALHCLAVAMEEMHAALAELDGGK